MEEENGSDGGMSNEEVQNEMARMLSSVKDMTLYNISILASQAWHHLGLVPMPGTEAGHKDLEQAKLAIDLFEANLRILSGHIEEKHEKELKRVLMDLHLNYVNKSKEERE
ncbi:MAG: DUF1844 domain-containing protein [Thermoplasmatota archaeon]